MDCARIFELLSDCIFIFRWLCYVMICLFCYALGFSNYYSNWCWEGAQLPSTSIPLNPALSTWLASQYGVPRREVQRDTPCYYSRRPGDRIPHGRGSPSMATVTRKLASFRKHMVRPPLCLTKLDTSKLIRSNTTGVSPTHSAPSKPTI